MLKTNYFRFEFSACKSINIEQKHQNICKTVSDSRRYYGKFDAEYSKNHTYYKETAVRVYRPKAKQID